MNESKSEIQSFYKNKTIFITGASGFMGKVLIEKLLYSCSDLNKIYILMRDKKGRSCDNRLEDMFKLSVRYCVNHIIFIILNDKIMLLYILKYSYKNHIICLYICIFRLDFIIFFYLIQLIFILNC